MICASDALAKRVPSGHSARVIGRRGVAFVVIVACALAAGGCGGGGGGGDESSPATTLAVPESTIAMTASTMPAPASTRCSGGAEQGDDVSELQRLVDETVSRRSARFEAEIVVDIVVGGVEATFRLLRAGSFDDESLEGVGTVRFDAEPAEARAALGGFADGFEFRLVDRTWWFFNPVPAEPGWLGVDVLEYAEAVGGDPLLNMDGDAWILVVSELAETVAQVTFDDQTCASTWLLDVDGDALAPLVLTSAQLGRLVDQVPNTGRSARVEVGVNDEGMVSTMRIDMVDWAAAADGPVQELGGGIVGMTIRFGMGEFELPVEVVAPCDDPSPHEEPGYPSSVFCPSE